MSLVIYTYHDPYLIDKESYWNEISNCPYFCVAQTLVNGLRAHYKNKFDGGRVTTVKVLTDSLYEDWASPAWIIKQHTIIDNIVNNRSIGNNTGPQSEKINNAFRFNRDEVFMSIRTLFELNVNPTAVLEEKLTAEQKYIMDIYRQILSSEDRSYFFLTDSLSEEEVARELQGGDDISLVVF